MTNKKPVKKKSRPLARWKTASSSGSLTGVNYAE
jgi:hypothetical protein